MVYNKELGKEIPKGWEIAKLGDHVDFIKGKKPKHTSEILVDYFLPEILIETLNGGKSLFASTTKMIIVNKAESIMVMDGANSGRVEIGHEGVLGSTLAKIISKTLTNFYLYYFLKIHEGDIKQNTTGTSIPHTDKEKIKNYIILMPDKNALNIFEIFVDSIFQNIVLNKNQIIHIMKIRDYLLPKLMSGKIRV